MTSSTIALNASSLSIDYGRHRAVDAADLALQPGRVTALVGPNGSGKTSLLRSMARLLNPSEGVVSIGAHADSRILSRRDFARMVTLLSQQRTVPGGLTVREAVEFGRHPHRSRWLGRDADGTAAIERALRLAGIEDLADHPLDTLSGGQVQRAWFASALAQDTGVLLLDEPTNHLDLSYQVALLELLRHLADVQGVAVGVVLHDLNQAAEVADQVVLMEAGRIAVEGTPQAVFTPQRLSQVYGIELQIETDRETGLPLIRTRVRRRSRPPAVPPDIA